MKFFLLEKIFYILKMTKPFRFIAKISFTILITHSLLFCQAERSIPIVDVEANMDNMKEIFLSDYAENIRYVPLDMNVLYYGYANYDISNDFILTNNGTTCYLFDPHGKLIRNIGNSGRGPGEYGNVNYLFLSGDKIFIVDLVPDDILEFTLEGTFIRRYRSGFTAKGQKYRFRNAEIINDSTIIGAIENFSGKEKYKALIINFDGEIKHSYKSYDFFDLKNGVKSTMSPKPIITVLNGHVYFKEYYNDTLFQLNDDHKLYPKLVFDLGKYKESITSRGGNVLNLDSELSSINVNQIYLIDNNRMIFRCVLNDHFPAKRLTPKITNLPTGETYTSWVNTKSVIGIYEFKNKKLVLSKPNNTDIELATSGFYNDIDAGPRFFPEKVSDSIMIMQMRFDYLINYINSDEFKNFIPKSPEKKEKLKLFVDSLSNAGFSNPIFMIVKFSKN